MRGQPSTRVAAAVMAWVLTIAVGAPAAAQQDRFASRTGRWLPWVEAPNSAIPAAHRASVIAVLQKIERILKQVPELANPDGFEVEPVFGGGVHQEAPGFDGVTLPSSVMEYGFSLRHFVPTRAIAGEGSNCISVAVNPTQESRLRDQEGRLIYIEGERGTPSTNPNISDSRVPKNATQVYGELWNVRGERSIADILFVTAGELPWKPVSREEYYRAILFENEGANGEKLADFRAALKTTPYQQWIAGAAQRAVDREAAMAQLEGILPDSSIQKMREEQEATEREVTEKLKQDEAMHRERNSEAYTNSFAWRDSMLVELGRMTPEERRMATYISKKTDEGPRATGWNLTTDSTPPNWRVLTPNLEFYGVRRSPVEIRSINVHISMTLSCLSPKIQDMLWKLYHTLDWAAINELLEQPR